MRLAIRLSLLTVFVGYFSNHRIVDAFIQRWEVLARIPSTRLNRVTFHAHSETFETRSSGLYYPLAKKVWGKLLQSFPSLTPPDGTLPSKVVLAKGKDGFLVRMETWALLNSGVSTPIRYARVALLETVPIEDAGESVVYTEGIQVLNLVILPNRSSSFPVWSVDFVALPGNKHLLFMDAQPMSVAGHIPHSDSDWECWHKEHFITERYPWGGDFPLAILPFVSKYPLWTRLQGMEDPVGHIQGPLLAAVDAHLDIYLNLLATHEDKPSDNQQNEYLKYRTENDPARPVLKALFGEEWSERVIRDVLFPL